MGFGANNAAPSSTRARPVRTLIARAAKLHSLGKSAFIAEKISRADSDLPFFTWAALVNPPAWGCRLLLFNFP